jgi:hypothetical protein
MESAMQMVPVVRGSIGSLSCYCASASNCLATISQDKFSTTGCRLCFHELFNLLITYEIYTPSSQQDYSPKTLNEQ